MWSKNVLFLNQYKWLYALLFNEDRCEVNLFHFCTEARAIALDFDKYLYTVILPHFCFNTKAIGFVNEK